MRPRLAAALLLATTVRTAAAATPDPCTDRGTALVIRASSHALDLCDDGQSIARYTVALARNGTGKRRSGDARIPLGTYTVGRPRPSSRYHLFVPIDYPTDEQRRQGYTGGHIGVHGPRRDTEWAGRANAWFDWTSGCIAVARDEEIERIADWVRRHTRPLLAHILP